MTFDCFGTLVSWQEGFPKILERVAGGRARELAKAYHRFESHIEAADYRPYRAVLRTTLRLAAEHISMPLAEGDYDVLAEHWGEQPLHHDVAEAIAGVRKDGWKLVALTNCDNDLFEKTKQSLPFEFDEVITAEDVGSYKPARGHFQQFARRGVSREDWIHVACSYFHDIEPARALGIKRIWIDRDHTGEDPASASFVQPDLQDLAQSAQRVVAGP